MENGGYAKFIRPILYIIDLCIISSLVHFYLTKSPLDIMFAMISWILLSIIFSIYEVYRFTKVIRIVSLLSRQIIVLALLIFAYYYIENPSIPYKDIIQFFFASYLILNVWRISLHYIFKKYRIITGSNYKKVIIVGSNEATKRLAYFFQNKPEYGYRFQGVFTDDDIEERKGNLIDSLDFITNNHIDEVYCSVEELTNEEIKRFIDFCDIHLKTLKFIPDNKELYAKNLRLDYYDLTPILSIRQIPLDDPLKSVGKRVFDITFSLVVICLILSWLVPILALLIKLESSGPVFFRQNRPGIKEKGFGCYKFRSMRINHQSEESATRNDPRITRIGKFMRKTSIDELPQFFNVFFGTMSVVGPRPHLWRQNELYGTEIAKYMVRHFVKPGITGLAQVKGYRGEIETKVDIVNRTKYDIFYIENWSLLLDFNIIIQTIVNIFQGEDKAY